MHLYELAPTYARLLALSEEDGEGAWEEALNQIGGELNEKVENRAKVIRALELEAEAVAAEQMRLTERATTLRTRAEWLSSKTKTELEVAGLTKVKGLLFTVSIQKNPPGVVETNPSIIPLDYWVQPPPPAPRLDRKRILAEWRDTKVTPPGVKVEQGTKLVIR
mgnify:FL=1